MDLHENLHADSCIYIRDNFINEKVPDELTILMGKRNQLLDSALIWTLVFQGVAIKEQGRCFVHSIIEIFTVRS